MSKGKCNKVDGCKWKKNTNECSAVSEQPTPPTPPPTPEPTTCDSLMSKGKCNKVDGCKWKKNKNKCSAESKQPPPPPTPTPVPTTTRQTTTWQSTRTPTTVPNWSTEPGSTTGGFGFAEETMPPATLDPTPAPYVPGVCGSYAEPVECGRDILSEGCTLPIIQSVCPVMCNACATTTVEPITEPSGFIEPITPRCERRQGPNACNRLEGCTWSGGACLVVEVD